MKGSRHWALGVRSGISVVIVLAVACSALAQAILPKASPTPPVGSKTLLYDDGKSDGKTSIAGATQTIVFEKPAGDWSLAQLHVFGSRYGYPAAPAENFDIYVCDGQMNVLKQYQRAYSTFDRGDPRWVIMPLERVLLTDKFYVLIHFHAEKTKGVYVHYDTSVPEAHSWVGVWGGETKPMKDQSDWMIRAVIAPGKPETLPAPEIPNDQAPIVAPTYAEPGAPEVAGDTAVLKYDDGTPDGKRSMAGSGHAVLFAKPAGDWQLTKVHIYGSRYGTAQAPRESFKVYVCDRQFNILKQYDLPYAGFQRGGDKWYDIPLDPVQVPEQFYVCFAFSPTRTKGVFVSYDKSVKQTHSKMGVPGGRMRDVGENLEWMIRATLTKAGR